MHIGTMLVFLAVTFVALWRTGFAVMVGGIGVWLVARAM